MEYLFQDAEAKIIFSEPGKETLIEEIDPGLINLIVDTQKPYQDIEICLIIKKAKGTKEEIALLKQKERNAKQFNIAIEKLERQFDKGIWTAKEFKREVAKLEKKILLKGGEI